MKRQILLLLLSAGSLAGALNGQRNVHSLPKEVFAARTVAIVNNTHNEQVEQGAVETLKRWGKLTLVDDSDLADIILTFEKKNSHEGTTTQKTNDDGTPSTSYGMSFGSSINMKATLKGKTLSFYTTTTGDSKKKAGASCVNDLQSAYIAGP